MPDIVTLLRNAAPQPSHALDLAAVRARRRRPLRSAAAWLSSLVAVAGVGIPATRLLVNAGHAGHGGASIRVIGPDQRGDVSEARVSEADAANAATATGSTPPSTLRSNGAAPSGNVAAPPGLETRGERATPGFPLGSGCSISSTGLANGEEASCRFTAERSGGWNVNPPAPGPPSDPDSVGWVTVIHDGVATTYRTSTVDAGPTASKTQGCADNIIQPGDRVEVTVKQSNSTLPVKRGMSIRAGAGYGCSQSGP